MGFLRSSAFVAAATAASAVSAEKMCYAPVDVIQVQDMTSSFDDRWPAMSAQIADVIQSIYTINPNSRFGFATFGDKPLEGPKVQLGYPDDYCLHVDVPLGTPSPASMQELFENYRAKAQGGGADWTEGVFEGLERALIAPQIGWNTRTDASRVVVVVTDATSHLAGDVAKYTGLTLPANSLTAQDLYTNENNLCADQEYPALPYLASVMQSSGANVIFIVAPGGSYDASGKFTPAASLANYGQKYWNENGLQLWYEDQLSSVGITPIVETMDPDMKVYAEAFKTALQRFQAWRCDEDTTPTPSATTSATTATSTTTVATTTTTPAPTTTESTTTPAPVETTTVGTVGSTVTLPTTTDTTTPAPPTTTPPTTTPPTPAPTTTATLPPTTESTTAPTTSESTTTPVPTDTTTVGTVGSTVTLPTTTDTTTPTPPTTTPPTTTPPTTTPPTPAPTTTATLPPTTESTTPAPVETTTVGTVGSTVTLPTTPGPTTPTTAPGCCGGCCGDSCGCGIKLSLDININCGDDGECQVSQN